MARRLWTALTGILVTSAVWTPRARARLLKVLGVRVGPGTRVHPGIRFIGSRAGLDLGRGVFVNVGLIVGSGADVVVGDRVHVGPRVSLLPTTHALGGPAQRAGATAAAPIRIGPGAWLGAQVVVLGGVTIGAGAVVAAGAVVHRDVAADTLVGGVPARHLRTLDQVPAPDGAAPAEGGTPHEDPAIAT